MNSKVIEAEIVDVDLHALESRIRELEREQNILKSNIRSLRRSNNECVTFIKWLHKKISGRGLKNNAKLSDVVALGAEEERKGRYVSQVGKSSDGR